MSPRQLFAMRPSLALPVLLAFAHAAAAQQPVASHATARPVRPPVREVARVNNVPLMSDRLDVALNALIPMESFHRNVSSAKVDELRKQALDSLVDEELRYQDGVRLHLTPSAAEINAGLARVIGGYRSRTEFDQARRRSGASMADITREIGRALVVKKAYERAVTSRCQVSVEETSSFFAEFPQRFVVPEQLHVYAITFGVDPGSSTKQWTEAKARAEDVLKELRGGAAFEQLARKYSTDPSRERGGDMGLVHRGSLSDEFERATRDLKAGQMSGVVQTLYGFHIVRIESIRPPEQKTFAEVAAGIRKDLTARRCAEMEQAWTARLRAGATIVIDNAAGGPHARTSGAPGER